MVIPRFAGFVRWCTRCIVSLNLVALVLLIYCALWREPQLSARRKHLVGDDGPHTGGYRHAPGTKHDHGGGIERLTIARSIFLFYIVLVHILGLVFPLRACWAISELTKGLKHAASGTRRKISASGIQLLQKSQTRTTPSPVSSGGSSSETLYDADDELPTASVFHAIILPNYREDIDTLRETLEVLACHPQAAFSYDIYLAMEQREPGAAEKASKLAEEFLTSFRNIVFTLHPGDIPGEAPGKSSNESWAAKEACRKYAMRSGSKRRSDVIFTVMDSDSHLSYKYFALITEMHLNHPDTANTTIYVPPIVFDRNANSVPVLVRVADLLWCTAGLSGLYETSAIRPPTSVYSLPLSLVERVDGWDTFPEAIGEDLHMYVKCFFALGGNLTTRTVFSAASQSNVHSDEKSIRGVIATHQARYKQAIRHMWGALDTGYAIKSVASLAWYGSSSDKASASPPARHHRVNIFVLFHRLYEAHFLPVHLGTLVISSVIYTTLTPAAAIPRDLQWAFDISGYLRILGALGMLRMLSLYERYHRTCVRSREDEMRRAGLYQHMQGAFTHRTFWRNALDYAMFPVSGILYGSVPAVQAQLCHFWTVNLTYSVSGKPQSQRKPLLGQVVDGVV